MKKTILLFLLFACAVSHSQITCETLQIVGVNYSLTACKNGRAKLMYTDTSIVNHFKHKNFQLMLVSSLSNEHKAEMKKYKINLNPSDTVIVYDWDILQDAKMGYFGTAIGKVRYSCTDSIIQIKKYFLKPGGTGNYTPTRFKLFRMNADNFIMFDLDHPYLNINYYFKKEKE